VGPKTGKKTQYFFESLQNVFINTKKIKGKTDRKKKKFGKKEDSLRLRGLSVHGNIYRQTKFSELKKSFSIFNEEDDLSTFA
jgi:hypothetical protein